VAGPHHGDDAIPFGFTHALGEIDIALIDQRRFEIRHRLTELAHQFRENILVAQSA